MIRQTLAAISRRSRSAPPPARMDRGDSRLGAARHDALKAAIAAPTRTPANIARDRYRHPYETLAFFGVAPVRHGGRDLARRRLVHRDPGALLLAGGGTYYAAAMPGMQDGRCGRMPRARTRRFTAPSASPPSPPSRRGETRVPDGSADVVLTFRNVHNWRMGYQRHEPGL